MIRLHALCALAFLFAIQPARADEEQDLIRLLQSSATTQEKCAACLRLHIIGTDRAVPVLEQLLTAEPISHAALHALEGIPTSTATSALRQAAERSTGTLLIGLIDALGRRRESTGAGWLAPFLSHTDPAVAASAATALGRATDPTATVVLLKALDAAPATVRPRIADALLNAAGIQLAAGAPDQATRIYQRLSATTEADATRVAAQLGLLRTAGQRALPLTLEALRSGDGPAIAAALHFAAELPDPNASSALAALLPNATPAMQAAVLRALRRRGDAPALIAARATNLHPDPEVRAAAAAILGDLGDADAVPWLIETAAAPDESPQRAARTALVTLHRGDVRAALLATLASPNPAAQSEALQTLATRGETAAFADLLRFTAKAPAATRAAAVQALEKLVAATHLPALVQALIAAREPGVRDELRGVFEALAEKLDDPRTLDLTPWSQALTAPDPDTRKALLQAGVFFTDDRVRSALRTALRDSSEPMRIAAARTLCQTRDPQLTPDLVELARTTQDSTLRSLAIEASARLLGDAGAGQPDPRRLEWLTTLHTLATTPADKRQVLSALGRLPLPGALALAEQTCTDPAVRAEAEIACLQIARTLPPADAPAAKAALARLATGAASQQVKTDAQTLLQKLDKPAANPPR